LLILQSAVRAAEPPRSAESSAPDSLFLTTGKSVLINSASPIQRVAIGSPEIAEASVITPTQIMVNGKAAGETSLIVWQEHGDQMLFDVNVQTSHMPATERLDAIRRQIKSELPGQDVNVSMEGDIVFLRGTVKDLTSSQRAFAIASAIAKTVNLLYVDVPDSEAEILLRVRFASMDRSVSTALGLNIFSTGFGNTTGSLGTQQFSPPVVTKQATGPATLTLSDALNVFLLRNDLNLGATIKALQVKGLLQILAEPDVLAINGKHASFLEGGEFPFPSLQAGAGGLATVTVQFREFGVRLNFTPVITPRGTIRLEVAPEVSALDYTNGLIVQGFNVPALTVRKVNTEVELSDGQSFAIAGLIDNRISKTLEKIPGLGNLPFFGKLFQSYAKNPTNTELLVIVTPELVHPIPAGKPVPEIKFQEKFLPPASGGELRTPGVNVTGAAADNPAVKSIPVEKLLQSIEQEQNAGASTMTAPATGPAQPPPAAGSQPAPTAGSQPAPSPPPVRK
jgi:pilus assembly protein CpaC